MMKFSLIALALSLSAPAFAGPQQEKMKECNKQAAGKKGEERKLFMKACLSARAETTSAGSKETAAAPAAEKSADPKQRMKDCNTQAKGKKGDERKSFMSSCLKGEPAAPAAEPAPAKM